MSNIFARAKTNLFISFCFWTLLSCVFESFVNFGTEAGIKERVRVPPKWMFTLSSWLGYYRLWVDRLDKNQTTTRLRPPASLSPFTNINFKVTRELERRRKVSGCSLLVGLLPTVGVGRTRAILRPGCDRLLHHSPPPLDQVTDQFYYLIIQMSKFQPCSGSEDFRGEMFWT